MSNHLHLIVAAKENNLSDILRDFKKFTSKQIVKAIQDNEHESRRECLPVGRELEIFKKGNQPKEFHSPSFVFRKLNYIHNNPVEAGIVDKPEEYLYSSARDYKQTKKCGLLDVVFI